MRPNKGCKTGGRCLASCVSGRRSGPMPEGFKLCERLALVFTGCCSSLRPQVFKNRLPGRAGKFCQKMRLGLQDYFLRRLQLGQLRGGQGLKRGKFIFGGHPQRLTVDLDQEAALNYFLEL